MKFFYEIIPKNIHFHTKMTHAACAAENPNYASETHIDLPLLNTKIILLKIYKTLLETKIELLIWVKLQKYKNADLLYKGMSQLCVVFTHNVVRRKINVYLQLFHQLPAELKIVQTNLYSTHYLPNFVCKYNILGNIQ